MSVEGPVSVAVISRLPKPEISTAAFLMMMGVAMWIESPVIDLLSTSTTLARSRQNFAAISRYVWYLIAWVTIIHLLVVFTPIYWFVSDHLLGVERKVSETARFGLAIMLPWSGFIGWRRYLQGVLIRSGRTKPVGIGTAVRMGTIGIVIGLLYLVTSLSGIEIAACALITAVGAEAFYIHWASRITIRERFNPEIESLAPEIDSRKLFRFHTPLALTTMIMLSTSPLITAALSRMPDPVRQLAAYQVASTLIWLMRTTVYALPETVITLYKRETAAALRKFCVRLGLVASGLMILLYSTKIDIWFFEVILGAKAELSSLAHLAVISAAALPFIGALQSYLRGTLTANHMTVSRLTAVTGNTVAFCAGLLVGIKLQGNGVMVAGISLSVSMSFELLMLSLSWRSGSRRLPATT